MIKRVIWLKAIGLAGALLASWVVTGFIPFFPLYQGRRRIGRIPLFAAWWMPHGMGIGLHLLLVACVTGLFALGWQLSRRQWRFSLKTLLLLMTLTAVAVAIAAALPGVLTFING